MFVSLSNPLISVPISSQKPSFNSKLAFPKSQISVRSPGVLVSRNRARSIRATAKKDSTIRIQKIVDEIFKVMEGIKSDFEELRQLLASEENFSGSLPIDAGLVDIDDRTRQLVKLLKRTREDPLGTLTKSRTPWYEKEGEREYDMDRSSYTKEQWLELYDRMSEDLLESLTKSGRARWYKKEGEREYKMRFDMPGLTKDDVKVWVEVNVQKKEKNVLVIKGEKVAKKANGEEGEEMERSYGKKYSKRFVLPENAEFQKIKARVRDGVLYVSIPKTAESGSEVKTAESISEVETDESSSEVETAESSSEVWDINVE